MATPLGKYSQVVAAGLAVFTVVSWTASEFLSAAGLLAQQPSGLKEVALIAIGAVFGAVATVNGIKPDIDAASRKAELAHDRLDTIDAPHSSAEDINARIEGAPR